MAFLPACPTTSSRSLMPPASSTCSSNPSCAPLLFGSQTAAGPHPRPAAAAPIGQWITQRVLTDFAHLPESRELDRLHRLIHRGGQPPASTCTRPASQDAAIERTGRNQPPGRPHCPACCVPLKNPFRAAGNRPRPLRLLHEAQTLYQAIRGFSGHFGPVCGGGRYQLPTLAGRAAQLPARGPLPAHHGRGHHAAAQHH